MRTVFDRTARRPAASVAVTRTVTLKLFLGLRISFRLGLRRTERCPPASGRATSARMRLFLAATTARFALASSSKSSAEGALGAALVRTPFRNFAYESDLGTA